MLETREQFFTFVGYGLVVLGFAILLLWGVPPLITALLEENYLVELVNSPAFQNQKPFTVQMFPYYEEVNILSTISVTFDRSLIFSNEQVNYTANVVVKNTDNVAGIALLFIRPNTDFTKITAKEAWDIVLNSRPTGDIIEFTDQSNPPFTAHGSIMFFKEDEIRLHGFVFKKDGTFEQISMKEPVFKVYPLTAKIQFDRDITESKHQAEADIKEKIVNERIIGLTVMGLGAIPIIIGADILLRLKLDPYIKPKSD